MQGVEAEADMDTASEASKRELFGSVVDEVRWLGTTSSVIITGSLIMAVILVTTIGVIIYM